MTTSNTGTAPTLESFQVTLGRITDPNVALVSYVTEVEERLRKVAADRGIDVNQPVTSVLGELQEQGLVEPVAYDAMKGLVELRNKAAHGARVSPGIVDLLKGEGMQVLELLNALSEAPD